MSDVCPYVARCTLCWEAKLRRPPSSVPSYRKLPESLRQWRLYNCNKLFLRYRGNPRMGLLNQEKKIADHPSIPLELCQLSSEKLMCMLLSHYRTATAPHLCWSCRIRHTSTIHNATTRGVTQKSTLCRIGYTLLPYDWYIASFSWTAIFKPCMREAVGGCGSPTPPAWCTHFHMLLDSRSFHFSTQSASRFCKTKMVSFHMPTLFLIIWLFGRLAIAHQCWVLPLSEENCRLTSADPRDTASDESTNAVYETITYYNTAHAPTETSSTSGPVITSFSNIKGPYIAAYSSTWSQAIIPVTVGTVMFIVNEATNKTTSTTI